jgi:hypothetical protein
MPANMPRTIYGDERERIKARSRLKRSKLALLFDHRIGAGDQVARKRDAGRLGGLEKLD